jgi:hypothetical protein
VRGVTCSADLLVGVWVKRSECANPFTDVRVRSVLLCGVSFARKSWNLLSSALALAKSRVRLVVHQADVHAISELAFCSTKVVLDLACGSSC